MGDEKSGSAAFIDEFSDTAGRYAVARPTYPTALFKFLADLAPARRCAWDCGTGNGQAATGLAEFFESVEASDASSEQIRHAKPDPRVRYRVAPAQASGLPDGSVDLISVAQALHWFDLQQFYLEVQRVARPGAVLAAYGYNWFYLSPQLALYLSWNLNQLLNYCRTWSATRSKIAAEGEQFLAAAHDALAGAWGNPELRRTVVMPITARLGRVP